MPKRIGHLYEKVVSLNNCRRAIIDGTKNLDKARPDVQRVLLDIDKSALYLSTILSNSWSPGPVRFKVIKEGPRRKERMLLIPGIMDHLAHVAIMRPAIPYLLKRYDFYSCGSIPKRGPMKVNNALKGWIRNDHYEYAAKCDVRKFYASIHPDIVMSCLRKIFKDQKYLRFHELILNQMTKPVVLNPSDITTMPKGVAIGFSTSHWYGNLVLTETDRLLRHDYPEVKFVRYMDDYALLSHSKTTLHSAVRSLQYGLAKMGLSLKDNWQVFPIASRPLEFLSYRYFADGRVIMRKQIMYSISRKAKTVAKNFNVHNSRSFISKIGTAKHAQNFTFKSNHIYPLISIRSCRRLISYVDKKRYLQQTAAVIRSEKIRWESSSGVSYERRGDTGRRTARAA